MKDCNEFFEKLKDAIEEEFPFSIMLKAESNLMSKVSLVLRGAGRRTTGNIFYLRARLEYSGGKEVTCNSLLW